MFIHSSIDGHFGCFQFLVILNKVSMNVLAPVFGGPNALIPLGYISRNGVLQPSRGRESFCPSPHACPRLLSSMVGTNLFLQANAFGSQPSITKESL